MQRILGETDRVCAGGTEAVAPPRRLCDSRHRRKDCLGPRCLQWPGGRSTRTRLTQESLNTAKYPPHAFNPRPALFIPQLNEWTVTYGQHQIRVVRTSSDGARLYVDDELLDTSNDLFASGDEPTLVGTFGEPEMVVEVFVKPSEKTAIRVNGKWVTGAQVYAAASD